MPWKDREFRKLYLRQWTEKNRAKRYGYNKKHYEKLKNELFATYGHCCQCCGESERSFLTIEHLKGNGGKERKICGPLAVMRKAIRSRDFSQYTILCMNCNVGKHRNGGVCPHIKEKVKRMLSEARMQLV